MNITERLADFGQLAGLKIINLIARSGGYEIRRNIAFGQESRQKLDFYKLTTAQSVPLAIFFYGGNWQSGERADYRFVADSLCQLGCDVIVPDYRLYPDVRFDGIINDAAAALIWALNHTPEDQPVYLLGHSAGAQIASLLCLNEQLTALTADQRQRIAGFIGLAGPYDFYPYTEDSHWDLFAPEDHYPKSQAVNYVRPDAPPMYLLHGAEDRRVRRGHSKSLMEKVQAVGGRAAREVYEGMGHVDIVVTFSRLHRRRSLVQTHIANFIRDPDSVMVEEAGHPD